VNPAIGRAAAISVGTQAFDHALFSPRLFGGAGARIEV
jgi:hypothetical protein